MNTLIFQTNYHTSAFNSFDMGPKNARRITQKKTRIPANRVALVAMGLMAKRESRPSDAKNWL